MINLNFWNARGLRFHEMGVDLENKAFPRKYNMSNKDHNNNFNYISIKYIPFLNIYQWSRGCYILRTMKKYF